MPHADEVVLGKSTVGTIVVRRSRPSSYQALQLFVGVLSEVFTDEIVAVDDQRQELATAVSLGHFGQLRQLTVVTTNRPSTSSSLSSSCDPSISVSVYRQ